MSPLRRLISVAGRQRHEAVRCKPILLTLHRRLVRPELHAPPIRWVTRPQNPCRGGMTP